MAYTASIGTGTTISRGATTFAQVTDIQIGDQSLPSIDITNLSSVAKDYMPGDLIDAGSITFDILILGKGDLPALGTLVAGTPDVFTVTFPDASTFVCSGHIESRSIAIPLEDKISCSITIKLTGAIT